MLNYLYITKNIKNCGLYNAFHISSFLTNQKKWGK